MIEKVYDKLPQDLKIITDELLNNNIYMDKELDVVTANLKIDKYKWDYIRYSGVKNMLENGIGLVTLETVIVTSYISYNNFKNHGTVKSDEIFEAMKRAKIVLNTIVYFENGSYERILSSILNRALVISNKNNYCYNLYKENIVYFDSTNKKELITKIKYYLEHDYKRKKIVYNVYKMTRKFNTW
ncbi:glycosyltransferase [Clostridium butyricum]|uniref:glycosyltransferase n=1 Tax=Clostridium butyricum TaxID=1492 RepID=UPI00374F1656